MNQTHLDSLIRDIVSLLYSRGREVTPDEVARWLQLTVERLRRKAGQQVDEERIAKALLTGNNRMLTILLHLYFGDALDEEPTDTE
jgi:hypothetical protein